MNRKTFSYGQALAFGLALIWLSAPLAEAQDEEYPRLRADSVLVLAENDIATACFANDRFIVVADERPGEVDSDFFIRPREGARCEPDSLPGDIVLRDEWAAYFSTMRGNVLILDSGTGPDIRDLILINMETGERIAAVPYVETDDGPDRFTLGVWIGSELEEPLPGCEAPPGGLIPGVDSLFFLDIRTGSTRFADQIRCANRQ